MEPSDEERGRAWQQRKLALMEQMLGPRHELGAQAKRAYADGGALNLFFFPQASGGVAIATQELSRWPYPSPKNDEFDQFELVWMTRHPLDSEGGIGGTSPFATAYKAATPSLNLMARYAEQATLNSGDTSEFPPRMPQVGGKTFVMFGLDQRSSDLVGRFGLMLLVEVFRSEMDFARDNGSAALRERLEAAGVYPYSDLDREPVV
jgi:hypothetical protein